MSRDEFIERYIKPFIEASCAAFDAEYCYDPEQDASQAQAQQQSDTQPEQN